MALQHALDIARINVFASRYEHIVAAPDKVVKAVVIAAKHVAGNIESIRRHRRLEIGPVMIAVHQGRTLDLQNALVGLALASQTQLHLGMRTANRKWGRR